MQAIKVHEKALAHLSRGLYRSPASALRELVSNGWDANATVVHIDTNYPNFAQISIEDNGDGFTRKEFERLMGGGIGNSEKRPQHKPLNFDRPLIGRLGIGMLGIAQICLAFTVISKPREGEGFRARVILYDLLKERLDSDENGLIENNEVNVGQFEFEEFDPKTRPYGTLILADDVHPHFVDAFKKSTEHEDFIAPSLNWGAALKVISSVHSLQQLGDYWRLLWELSVACPLPYLNVRTLPRALIKEDQKRLAGYNFKVVVDGIILYKPVFLKGNPGGYTVEKIIQHREKIYDRTLAFHGYLVVQEGKQLKPDELRGILIRIKNVAIGYYDPSMLDYRFNEGPRTKWLTGEIYVDEGLENALNVDRDSFNRFHPEFGAVQKYIHTLLHDKIFPRVYLQIDERSEAKTATLEKARQEFLRSVIETHVGQPVVIRSTEGDAKSSHFITVSKAKNARGLEITIPDWRELHTKKAYRQLASSLMAIYEIAKRQETLEDQRALYTELLTNLLKAW